MTDAFTFGFPLDDFQLDSLRALDEGRSVVVCAPTGSGKTVVAEHAIHLALARGQRLFYTTPLKALSNQKFRDFSRRYGPERVGLLTGDVSIRGRAPVVIMTTEVFRNMLFGVGPDSPGNDLAALRFVVLDECHYINDAGRGTVWEESILGSPPSVQLVALSATIANPEQLAGWIREVHGPTDLILSYERPVPLEHHYYHAGQLSPLSPTADRRPGLPPCFGASEGSLPRFGGEADSGGVERQRWDATADQRPQTAGDRSPSAWHQPLLRGTAGREVRSWETAVDPDEVVAALAEREMLPAIYFVFSRQGCEAALLRCAPLELLSAAERQRARERIEVFLQESPSLRFHPHLRYLARGSAVHHAGLLPAWKRAVEDLFQAGLVRVVFATETLAAGINMPARTTVISSLHKPASGRGPRGATRRSLTASEFLQMSGRAGRRGMDRLGHVVVVGDPHVPRAEAVRLASAPPDPLFSRFAPTYSLVIHLLKHRTPEEIRDLLSRSFGEYLARGRGGEGAREREDEAERESGSETARERSEDAAYWRRFLGLKGVLEEYGCLAEDRPNALGALVGSIRATNELLVAEVVRPELDAATTAAHLAGALVALVTEPKTAPSPSRPRALAPSAPRPLPSPRVRALLTEIDTAARALRSAQRLHRVDVPVTVADGAAAWTEAWASGASWESVLAVANADEGDVVYTLRSLIDLLRQVAAAPGVPDRTRDLAKDAAQAIDRDPVDQVV